MDLENLLGFINPFSNKSDFLLKVAKFFGKSAMYELNGIKPPTSVVENSPVIPSTGITKHDITHLDLEDFKSLLDSLDLSEIEMKYIIERRRKLKSREAAKRSRQKRYLQNY